MLHDRIIRSKRITWNDSFLHRLQEDHAFEDKLWYITYIDSHNVQHREATPDTWRNIFILIILTQEEILLDFVVVLTLHFNRHI